MAAWYDNPTIVRGFGEALTEAGFLEDQDEYQRFFRKPYMFDVYFTEWKEHGYPSADDDTWQAFIDAISADSDEEDEEDE